ncbi:molecular chaperone DnaJ [Rhizophagus clarus]|uniref:Molecular chaperone DnaJ n=1 Tax=Rhizophagus clarus TaxID=94130 RepID=A0A8H3QWI1_9GLOM|nr:molecular chaperone DnaJ [Rhizophagus clarus]
MDLHEKLRENKRQLEYGEIDENEYNKRKKSLLNKWTDESKKTKKIEPIHVNKPKEMDLYEILKLKPNATKAEISSSYRKLAMKYHPDKNGGVETEEWGKISKAYKILADDNSRSLYDNYGTINNFLEGKASFNPHVGGELWQPYIGNLEIGLWLLSFMDNDELVNLASTEQKERRHVIRVSNIVRYLQDKLIRFPEKDESSKFEISLYEEAKKLSAEPNGRKLLSTLALLRKEINKLIWKLSKSEISSIARETCEKVLRDGNRSKGESDHLAKSMQLLGKVWLKIHYNI